MSVILVFYCKNSNGQTLFVSFVIKSKHYMHSHWPKEYANVLYETTKGGHVKSSF